MFDVRLGAGTAVLSGEDTDFVYRALVDDIPISYEPALVIYHDHGRTGAEAAYREARGHAMGMGAIMIKHLLAGRTDLIKPVYWDFCSALGRWRRAPREWRPLLAKTALITGMVRYLVRASREKSGQ